jgi:nucleoside-diphosphate-sugar epimerase
MSMVVTGATGFIGRHLLQNLSRGGETVRALTRREPPRELLLNGIQWVIGDLEDQRSWDGLLEPGCTVFNLAYSAATVAANAVQAVERMVEKCSSLGVRRLIHCSTVSVFGEISDPLVTEATSCHPKSDYGKTKLDIERTLTERSSGKFQCAILRPSTVFGEGGLPLAKLIEELSAGPSFSSYLRASFFGCRRVHLVSVETVVAALLHICQLPLNQSVEVFIVSEDDEKINNFHDVRQILREQLQVPDFRIPPVNVPHEFLEAFLRILRRPNTNTRAVYSAAKLRDRGFVAPIPLEQTLRRYARECRLKRLT